MAENTALKKVDHKIMSTKRCTECGELLKENKIKKGHTKCYPCFKLYDGKPYAYEYKFVDGVKIQVIDPTTQKPKIRRDFLKEQKANRIKNNWK